MKIKKKIGFVERARDAVKERDNFVKERNEALISLDEDKILAYSKKYGIKVPDELGETFWTGIHKARIAINSIPDEEKEISRKWLHEHDFEEEINIRLRPRISHDEILGKKE